jgi:hypothetical protein
MSARDKLNVQCILTKRMSWIATTEGLAQQHDGNLTVLFLNIGNMFEESSWKQTKQQPAYEVEDSRCETHSW